MAMSSSIRRRSGLTDEWIGCEDIGSSSRAEGQPFMLGARPGLPQPLIAAYECARPRPKHPSRGAGSCMGAKPQAAQRRESPLRGSDLPLANDEVGSEPVFRSGIKRQI